MPTHIFIFPELALMQNSSFPVGDLSDKDPDVSTETIQ